jgi:hypothetical protein
LQVFCRVFCRFFCRLFCRLFACFFLQVVCRYSYLFREHVTLRVYENLQSTGFMRDRVIYTSFGVRGIHREQDVPDDEKDCVSLRDFRNVFGNREFSSVLVKCSSQGTWEPYRLSSPRPHQTHQHSLYRPMVNFEVNYTLRNFR